MLSRKPTVLDYVRALRLPFITASVLPFIFGSFIRIEYFRLAPFIFGLLSVVATHLGANVINDYADSKSGADWNDKKFYTFFGGSKLIQEGVIEEKTYLKIGVGLFFTAMSLVLLLTLLLRDIRVLGYYCLILFLGFSYSHKPLQLSYHRFGEITLFVLFGPVLVMGAYFLQTLRFPTLESFALSLPFGFFTTAILFANEIPDFVDDQKAAKNTAVSIVGSKKAYLVYYALIFLGYFYIAINIRLGLLHPAAYAAFIFLILVIRAGSILRCYYEDKHRLMQSSRLTIILQSLVSIVLIVSILL